MPYIGNQPAEQFTSFATQEFSTSATTSYTLDHAVTNENEIALFVNNVRQQPGSGKAYTASGTTLTLSAATASTDTMYCVFLGKAVGTVNAPAGSVAASQLAADSVTAAKLNDDIISGQTELASEPADTDEFLVSDAGTLKRIDYSLIKGGGITNSQIWLLTADQALTGSSSFADITADLAESGVTGYARIGDAMSESSGIFTFPTTGIWTIEAVYNFVGSDGYCGGKIQVTTNNATYSTVALSSEETDNQEYANAVLKAQVDVTDTSNVKAKFQQTGTISGNALKGNANYLRTGFIFTRIGDT